MSWCCASAWRSLCIELSVWRIHRRIGMSGGLFVNALLRETGHQLTKDEAARLQRSHAEAYARLVGQVPSAAGRAGIAGVFVRREGSLGHRDQRPDGKCRSGARNTGGGPRQDDGDHPGLGSIRETESRPFSGRGRSVGGEHCLLGRGRRQRLGSAGRPAGHRPAVSVCFRAATAKMNSRRRAPIESTTIRLICYSTWTRWACGGPSRSRTPWDGLG